MIHDLVFKDRRAQLLLHLRVLLHEFEEGALLPRILAGLGHHGLGHFGIGHGDLGLAAHFGQKQAKAHAAFGQRFMLVGRLHRAVIVAMLFGVLFMPQLMRNLVGFGGDQRCRQIELHQRVQLVQQRPLHHGARCAQVFRLKPFGDLCLQRVQAVGTVFPGQLIIDFSRLRTLHGLHRAGENGGLAGQMPGPVSLGEGHVDRYFIPRLGTGELFFEARNERAGAEHQRIVFRRPALERLAIHRPGKVDHDLIAVLGLGAFLAVFKGLGRAGQIGQSLVHGRSLGLHHQTLQHDVARIELRDRRQRLIDHLDNHILAFGPAFAAHHLDFGLQGRAVAAGIEMRFHRSVDGVLHRITHQARAELLAQHGHRNLALAEALHLDLGLRLDQLFLDLCVKLGRRHRDGVGALQTFVQGFGDLHRLVLLSSLGRAKGIPVSRR